jgi:CheY-like chemotaxis protein
MNAPFQARAGLRDPFTAFVCDDATADMLRPVAVEHGWSPEKVNKGGLRNAVQSLSGSASPNILFVDLSESADPLNDINALAEVCEPGTIVIASGTVNDVRLYRDLVASGIHDYLLKPFTVDQLRDTFAHAQMIQRHSASLANLRITRILGLSDKLSLAGEDIRSASGTRDLSSVQNAASVRSGADGWDWLSANSSNCSCADRNPCAAARHRKSNDRSQSGGRAEPNASSKARRSLASASPFADATSSNAVARWTSLSVGASPRRSFIAV